MNEYKMKCEKIIDDLQSVAEWKKIERKMNKNHVNAIPNDREMELEHTR
jgi:hypothetical protein